MMDCHFYNNEHCSVLTTTKCVGCKFRKTEVEFYAAQEYAEAILKKKGLRPVVKRTNMGHIMSVERDE